MRNFFLHFVTISLAMKKKTVITNAVQNKSVSVSSSGVTKKVRNSPSPVSFCDLPLFVDDKEGGWTLSVPEGRHLGDFLRTLCCFKSSKKFAGCVHALLTRDLAVSFLKKNYVRSRSRLEDTYKHFEDMLGKFERKVMKINEDYKVSEHMSKVASKLCDAYHETFGDYDFADDQAHAVTRLMRDVYNVYYTMDKSHKKLLDDVFPDIVSDDGGEDDDQTPDSVADFVMRYVREHDATEDLRLRDVIGSGDLLKRYEDFIRSNCFCRTEPSLEEFCCKM